MANDDFGYRYLAATRLLRSIALIYLTIAMPLYLVALHVSIVYIGLVVLAVMSFNLFVTFSLGMLGDRAGYRYALIISEIISFSGITVLAFSTSIYVIILGIILSGVTGSGGALRGSMSAGLTAYVANNWKEDKERASRLAGIFVVGAIGSVIGSMLLYFNAPIRLQFGILGAYRVTFMLASALLLVSIILLLRVKDSPRPKKTTRIMKMESLKYTLRVMASNAVTGMGIGLAIPLMPLWFTLSFHLSTSSLSYIFIGYYAVAGIGSYVARRISHRVNLVNMGSATRVVNGLFLIAMAFSPIPLMAALFYELYAFTSALGVPSRSAINIKGINQEDYGTASTLQGLAISTSQFTGGLSGLALEYALPLPPLVGGILQSLGGVVYKKLMDRKQQ